ncbi:glucose-6-phosphate dehydrogenase assembly protein OpcA [Corynebacterium anserum]|uniref:Oxppcycle protein OpcA n=1 Tax=Corynebacterium anserum TaxID=2684406 RepID=A0A7G7YNF8_9CORY|nr:glucose-6-phosphate dehydrogenase assembly protein OpcA [Corynebacterium anserum]MBC2681594.1 oxppcycle protein OpcA [Corynebacterium anserum]QNH96028.1 oxppcycle protein OpcA [Corynebacterium anserum]
MIIDLPNTKTVQIVKRLRALREERGEVATGRVLTFIVVVNDSDNLDRVIASTHEASREHPARVVVMVSHRDAEETRLDAEIRIAGDAGASEIIVMHLFGTLSSHRASVVTPLLLPDTPVVVWWPSDAPRNPSTDPLGALATRRITDSFHDPDNDALYRRRMTYTPGDSDLTWSRITLWRGLLASTLDQPPHEPIRAAEVYGPADDASLDIAAGWLADRLDVPVTRHATDSDRIPLDDEGYATFPIERAVLRRDIGDVEVSVVNSSTVNVRIDSHSQSMNSNVTLTRRAVGDCLAEELRHLDPDHAFGHALRGLVRVNRPDRRGRFHRSLRVNNDYFDGLDKQDYSQQVQVSRR